MITTTTAKGQLLQSQVNYHSQRLGSSSTVGEISSSFFYTSISVYHSFLCNQN